MPDGTYAHSCVAARVDVVCGAVNATAVAPRKARASFMIAVGACARSRRSVAVSLRSSRGVAAVEPWRVQVRGGGGRRPRTARSAVRRPAYCSLLAECAQASHSTAALLHVHFWHQYGCFAAVSLQAELRAAFLRAVFALVAVKLVQKGDEPLGTANKGVCGRWDAR